MTNINKKKKKKKKKNIHYWPKECLDFPIENPIRLTSQKHL